MDIGLTGSTAALARERFAKEFFPRDETNPLFLERLTEVIERLHTLEKWIGFQATFRVDVTTEKTFYLPYYLESVAGAILDRRPAIVQGSRYEFVHDGPGEVTSQDSVGGVLVDLGSFGSQVPFPETASTLTVAATQSTDHGKEVRILGFDASGNWITDAQGTPGVGVVLAGSPVVTSQTFSAIKGVQKPYTAGVVTVTHTVGSTLLLRAESYMRNPIFRGYRVLDQAAQSVLALCKRRAVPVTKEEDYLFPGNLSALKLAMYALSFEENADMKNAQDYFRNAITLLNAEASHYQGGAQETLDYSIWGPGISNIQNQR